MPTAMSLELIGVCEANTGDAIRAGGQLAGQPIVVVARGSVAAILSPGAAQRSFNPFARHKEALAALVTRQKMLEAAIAAGPFLAAKPGSLIADEDAAASLLVTHREGLGEHLASHGALVQFQISVTWNPQKALAALKDDAGIRAAAEAPSPKAAGLALRSAMMAARDACKARYLSLLAAASRDMATLPVATENDILNVAVLIARDQEPGLDAAVQAIDDTMPDALTIAYRGPSPCLSFAALILETPDQASLAQARELLDVTQDASVAMLRGAFHAVARRAHPDAGGGVEAFRQAQEAYATLRAEAEHGARVAISSVAATDAAASKPMPTPGPRLIIRREGELPWVA